MVETQEEIKNEEIDMENLQEGEEDDEEDLKVKGDYTQQLVKACQRGDFDLAKKCIEKKLMLILRIKRNGHQLFGLPVRAM